MNYEKQKMKSINQKINKWALHERKRLILFLRRWDWLTL